MIYFSQNNDKILILSYFKQMISLFTNIVIFQKKLRFEII